MSDFIKTRRVEATLQKPLFKNYWPFEGVISRDSDKENLRQEIVATVTKISNDGPDLYQLVDFSYRRSVDLSQIRKESTH